MKDLEKAREDYAKAKDRMEKSKARYEADLKRFRKAEADLIESENLTIVTTIRALDIPVSELKEFIIKIQNGMDPMVLPNKEETKDHDESGENEEEQREAWEAAGENADGEDE